MNLYCFLFSMCEVYQTHVKIGSSPDALEQFICIAHSSHYDIWHAQVAFNLLSCVAQANVVHHCLAADSVIGGIMDACEYRSECGDAVMDVMLLRYTFH